jgi:peptidoglycan-associated lipoprotein
MKNILITFSLAVLLTACGSKNVKPTEEVAMEQTPTVTETAQPAVQEQAAESTPTTTTEINPFDDPNNLLSHQTIYFDLDQYTIKPEFTETVMAHAQYLAAHPSAAIVIQGHADERGTSEYNLALGQKRAVSVKSLLNLHGVSDSQIETISYGKEKPAAYGHDEESWAQNRRALIEYSSK